MPLTKEEKKQRRKECNKKYNKKNKEKKNELHKKYYEKNKEKIWKSFMKYILQSNYVKPVI